MAKETQVQTNEEAEKKHVDELVARVAAAQKKYAEYEAQFAQNSAGENGG